MPAERFLSAYLALQETNATIKVCMGNARERIEATNRTAEHIGKGCIVDAITLYVCRRLKLENVLIKLFGTIFVTQTTVDVFGRQLFSAEEEPHDEQFFLSYRNGEYFKTTRTAAEITAVIDLYKSDVNWIRTHCTILHAVAELPPEHESLSRVLDDDSIDVLLAAKASDALPVIEEVGLRATIQEVAGRPATWLQPVLLVANNRDIITREEYTKAVNGLLLSNHHFMSLTPLDIYSQAKSDNWEVTPAILKLMASLGTPTIEMKSAVTVAGSFLSMVWGEVLEHDKAQRLTFAMLEALTRNHGAETRDIMVALVRGTKSILSDPTDFNRALAAWARGHFLLPFG